MNEETTTTPAAEGSGDRPSYARDKDSGFAPGEPRFKSKRRRKVSYLTINKIYNVDYKDVNILRRFINERGKILPSRQTGNTAKQQRMIAAAIRRARELALLPFVVTEMQADRREFVGRRERGPRRDTPYQEQAPQQARETQQQQEEAAAE
jgi:small subunit ribosomal protein S18